MMRFSRWVLSRALSKLSISQAIAPLALIASLLAPAAAQAVPQGFPASGTFSSTVGVPSLEQAFILSGDDTAPASFTTGAVTVSGAGFTLGNNNCSNRSFIVVAGLVPPACEINVTFTPTGTAPVAGSIDIPITSTGGTFTIPLTGNGFAVGAPVLQVSPTTINFNSVFSGFTSYRSIQVVNTGGADLPLNPPTGLTDFFLVNDTCSDIYSNVLPAGQDCFYVVEFSPFTPDSFFSNTLNISSPDTSVPAQNVDIFGFVPGEQDLADLLIYKSANPAQVELPPGGPVTFTYTVENSLDLGGSEAGGVVVRDLISGPFSVDLGSLPGFCTLNPTSDPLVQELICEVWDSGNGGFGVLQPGDSFSFSIQGNLTDVGQVDDLATVRDEFGNDRAPTLDPNLLNNSAVASVVGVASATTDTADLRLVQEPSDLTPNIGDVVTYQIRIRNDGPDAASNLTFRDIAVGSIQNLNVSASGAWTCAVAGGNPPVPPANPRRIECTLASLTSGATANLTLTGTVNGSEPIANSATVSAGGSIDPNLSNNDQSTALIPQDPNGASGDLAITKAITSAAPFAVGTPINYQINVTNNGGTVANGVVVTDRILGLFNGGAAVTGTFTNCDGGISNLGDSYFCQILSIPAGATRTVTYSVTPTANGVLSNVATVGGGGIDDSNEFNNEVTVNAAVAVGSSDLSVTKEFTGSSAAVGAGNAQFTIRVTNNSGVAIPLGGVQLTDSASGPVNFTGFANADGLINNCALTAKQVTCDSSAIIGVGVTATLIVNGDILGTGATSQIDNVVSVSSQVVADPDTSNNTAVASVIRGTGVADLSVTKSVDQAQAPVGATVNYTVTVTNNSATPATDAILTDLVSGPITIDGASVAANAGCTLLPPAGLVKTIRCDLDAFTGARTITYSGVISGNGQIDNIASVSDRPITGTTSVPATQDTDESNNSAVASTFGIDPALPALDFAISKEASATGTTPGSTVTSTIVVRNGSASVSIPAGTQIRISDINSGPVNAVVSATPGCAVNAVNNKEVDCNLTTAALIAPGATITTVTVTGVLTGAGQVDDVASVTALNASDSDLSNNVAVASVNGSAPVQTADLRVLTSVDQPTAEVGSTVNFEVVLRNLPGGSAANAVTLTSTVSGPFTLSSALPAACTSAVPANPANVLIVTCNYASIATATNRTLTITGTLDAPGVVSNSVAAYASNPTDPIPSNNVAGAATFGFEDDQGPDLSITKSVDLPQSEVGDTVTYTLNVTNNDSAVSPINAVVTDIVSGPVTIDAASVSAAGCSVLSTNPPVTVIECNLGSMAPNATTTITYQGQVTAPGQSDNIASVADTPSDGTPGTIDPNQSNNSAIASTVTLDPDLPTGDLGISKTATDTTVAVGAGASFNIVISNEGVGPIPAGTIVQMTDLPSGDYTNLASVPGPVTCDFSSGTSVECSLTLAAPVAAGAQVASFLVTLDVNGPGPIVNTASVSSPNLTDVNESNNTASAAVNGEVPVNRANLRLIQTVTPAQAQVGDPVSFVVTVGNNGPDQAGDARLHNIITGPFQINSVTPAGGVTCNAVVSSGPGEQRINCLGDLNNGAVYSVTILGEATAQGVISNSASVSAQGSSNFIDPRLANNGATASFLAVDSVCGDGLVEAGEQCDDGNAASGDGCSATCQYETVCGDGLQEGLEQCDDGNTLPGDGCDDLCRLETVCGDNLQEGVEECDDGNAASGDGCDEFCRLEGADLSVIKSVDVAQAALGQTVTFTVTVNNNGPRAATNVVVTDQVVTAPNTFTIDSIVPSSGSCTPTPPAIAGSVLISCALGSMDADDTETIVVTGTVTGLGQIDNSASVADTNATQGGGLAQVDPNPSNNVSVASVNGTAVAVDLSITKVSSAAQAGPDQDVTFTITINNPSTSTVSGVVVTDQIDGPFTINSISAPNFTCPAAPIASPSSIVCTPVGNALPAGTSVITMTGRTTGEGQVDNTVSIDSSVTSDPNRSNNTSVSSVIGVAREADLSVIKTVDNPLATVGDTVTFTVVVTNNDATFNAEGVRITDIATGPMEVQSMNFSVGSGTCTPSLALPASAQPFLTFVCIPTAGEIGPGGEVEIEMVAEVTGEGQIDNTVSVDSTITHDGDHSNNTAVASVNGAALADLRVTKTVVNGPIFNIGDTVDFEVTIENRGPNDATNVTLTDMQLGGLSFDAPPAGCTVAGNNMSCDVTPLLASGDSITVAYSSTANVAGLWSNIATVSSDVEDRILSNNTTSANVGVGVLANTADLEVTKTADIAELKQGGEIHYTVTVTNNGPDEATEVVLNDFIAGSFDSVSDIVVDPDVGACTELNGLITCTIDSVPSTPGFNSFDLTYTVTTSEAGPISNLAVVGGAVADPIQENNSASYQVKVVEALADVSITKAVDPNPSVQGESITYRLLVKNAGPDEAVNVIAVDQISGKFSNVVANSSAGSCSVASAQADTSTVTCELGNLASGGEVTITITVTGEGLLSILSNLASVYSETADPVLGNNAATADTIQLESNNPPSGPLLEGSGNVTSGCSLGGSASGAFSWIGLGLIYAAAFIRKRK